MKPPGSAPLFPHLRPVSPGWAPSMFPGRAMVEPPPPWAAPHGDGAASSPAAEPPPRVAPPVVKGRWCYRCTDCLDVCFAGELVRGPFECGACGGALECMGEVYRDRVTEVQHACACDYRCTGAAGPMCDCHCGGVNHGSGRTVEVRRDLGPAPRVTGQRDPCELRRRGDQYRAAMADAAAKLATLHPGSVEAWRLRRAVSACRDGRTGARVAKLRAALDTALTKH